MLIQAAATLEHEPLTAIVVLFGAGLLTSLTPCIYPMIPITAGVVTGAVGDTPRRARAILMTLTYVLGLALFYALMGLLAGLTGQLFGTVASSPWTRFAIANLLLLFGLGMLDVFPIRLPQRFERWAASRAGGSYPAVFVLGATSGLVAAPCGAPAFAAVLTWVSQTGSAVLGFVYLFVFSIGMSALLIVVGVFAGTAVLLPRSGTWLLWVKRGAGVLLLAMAEYYLIQVGMVL